MQSGELKACIIPVAATEQHLEHLAMEHDWRSVNLIADRVAAKLAPQAIVAPSMNIGISEHHMRHIGTLTAMPGSWLGVLFDTIRSMNHAGFTNILVLNGHGGNIAPCLGMWGQFQQRLEINLQFESYWDFLPKRSPKQTSKQRLARPRRVKPRLLWPPFRKRRADAMQDQPDKEPLEATAEAGAAMIDAIVDNVAAHVQKMIDGESVADIPAFHP